MTDYIKRSEARRAMLRADSKSVHLVEAIPAADVRPARRGKWIPVGTDDMDEGMFKCSECGSENFFPEILLGIPADNYCSNCGADMRETNDEKA